MACERSGWIEPYLARELSALQLNSFEEHLAECEECRTAASEGRLVDALLVQGNARIPVDTDWLHSTLRVVERTTVENSKRSRRRWTAASCLAAAAGIAIVAVNFHAMQPARNPSRQPRTHELARRDFDEVEESKANTEPSVVAMEGYLVAKQPSPDDSVEVYWVLPTESSF